MTDVPWIDWYQSLAKPSWTPAPRTILGMMLAIWPHYRWVAPAILGRCLHLHLERVAEPALDLVTRQPRHDFEAYPTHAADGKLLAEIAMCTNFKHPKAADGTVCVGRTMEFPDVLPWQLGVLAADHVGKSSASKNAKTWKAKYGVVGMAAFEPYWLGDGMNTAGLSAHVLYMPGHCTYQAPKNDGTDIGALEGLAFILGTCATTAEAKAALATCNFVDYTPKQVPVALPLHAIVHDKDSCIVAEFHPDGMRVHDNPLQIATNAPYLEWHLTNITNYLSLSPTNPAPLTIGGTTFAPAGQGQGFRGLPADENSPSRFVRLFANVHFATPPADERHAMMDTIRILHGFDLVPGTVIEDEGGGKMAPLLTMWSTVSNLTGKSYSYNTIDDPTWYQLDLSKLDFSKSRIAKFVTSGWLTPATI